MGPEENPGSPSDLYDVVVSVWRRRLLIAGAAVVGAIVGVVISLFLPVRYTASTTLMVTQAAIGNAPRSGTSSGNYRALLRNRGLATRLIDEFGLDQPPHNVTPVSFPRDNVLVRETSGTDLLELEVTLGDPDRAAEVANRLAELALELHGQISASRSEAARAMLESMLEDAEKRYNELSDQLLEFRTEAQIEMLRTETTTLVRQWGDLLDLRVNLETERARLATAEQELAGHDRLVDVRRYLVDDRLMMEAVQQSEPQLSPLGTQLQYEFLNPVYQILEQQIAESRTRIAALESTHAQYEEELRMTDGGLPELSGLYRAEVRLGELELEYEMAERVYSDLKLRFEQTGLDIAARSAGLQVIDPAMPPTGRTSPATAFNALAGLLVGLTLSLVCVLLARTR